MQFYFDLLEYSYLIQPFKTILYNIPCMLFALLTIFLIINLISEIKEPAGRQQFGKAILCVLLFVFCILSLSVSIASIPDYHSVKLSKELSHKIINTYYNDTITFLKDKNDFSYEQLSFYKNEKEFNQFKENFLNVLPLGKTVTTREVKDLFQNEHTLFLTCLESDKKVLLESKLIFNIDDIEKSLQESLKSCSIKVSKNVINKQIKTTI